MAGTCSVVVRPTNRRYCWIWTAPEKQPQSGWQPLHAVDKKRPKRSWDAHPQQLMRCGSEGDAENLGGSLNPLAAVPTNLNTWQQLQRRLPRQLENWPGPFRSMSQHRGAGVRIEHGPLRRGGANNRAHRPGHAAHRSNARPWRSPARMTMASPPGCGQK